MRSGTTLCVRRSLLFCFGWHSSRIGIAVALWLAAPVPAQANLPLSALQTENQLVQQSVEQLAVVGRQAVVVVTYSGRDGTREGLGSGVLLSSDGLVATNLHVIGEARPITVELFDGRTYPVRTVIANDPRFDLALVKIDAQGLPYLPLGDGQSLQQGEQVVAIGNPLGLHRSVVSGVLSGRREIEGRSMLQLAIPIERGNSGGPVLDRYGRVQGLLTLKAQRTVNLGFAVSSEDIWLLLDRPNPIPMSRWLTIGVLDPAEWSQVTGGEWSQRAGKMTVRGLGDGAGGRALCLASSLPPAVPFEVATRVRYSESGGAAGLVFCTDALNRHYGFYCTNGGLRLTRFDGPVVFAWRVLNEVRPPRLDTSEWNDLRVRVEPDRILCYLNDQLVIESRDAVYRSGRVGLCQFRGTEAEFKRFEVGAELQLAPATEAGRKRVRLTADEYLNAPPEGRANAHAKLVEMLAHEPASELTELQSYQDELTRKLATLGTLRSELETQQVLARLAALLDAPDDSGKLLTGALLIAQLDRPELDVAAYQKEVAGLAHLARPLMTGQKDDDAKLGALNQFLYQELGFHGSRGDYQNRANSYINEVIDDREGIPITLAILYIEIARQLGVAVDGVGLPGHFVVQRRGAPANQLIDVYDGGQVLTRGGALQKVAAISGVTWSDDYLNPVSTIGIWQRMLRNLQSNARREEDFPRLLRYAHALIVLDQSNAEDRFLRAALQLQLNQPERAQADLDWLMQHPSKSIERRTIEELREAVERALSRQRR